MHLVIRHGRVHRCDTFLDDARVFHVEGYPEAVDAAGMDGDAAIAEIQPEQVDVVRPELIDVVLKLPTSWA
jgi:hypothetical protein